LLDEFGSDVTVFIVSDHGFQSDRIHGGGTHRKEGIFLASGPGIFASDEILDLSVYDIAPTILAGLGLPVASDMSSEAFVDLFESSPLPRVIESDGQNVSGQATGLTPDRIDASTEEQLRSLGYIE
jgi:arylsulfatase A-like enzyme